MKDFKKLLEKANDTPSILKVLNPLLRKMIPFNRPHRLNVEELTDSKVRVRIPYKRNNLNHLKGIHACALSTASEYSSGLLILRHLGTKEYRLIMKTLKTEYHYQGREAIDAVFELSKPDLMNQISEGLNAEGKADLVCEIKAFDQSGNHICTTECLWQIKSWHKVKSPA